MVRHSCDPELVLDICVFPEQEQNNNVQFAVCLREKQDVKQPPNNKTPVKDEVRYVISLFVVLWWIFSITVLSSPDFNETEWHGTVLGVTQAVHVIPL